MVDRTRRIHDVRAAMTRLATALETHRILKDEDERIPITLRRRVKSEVSQNLRTFRCQGCTCIADGCMYRVLIQAGSSDRCGIYGSE
eukprot:1552521-Amphidinium_carterae.1